MSRWLLLLLLFAVAPLSAHEIRPAYLEMNEISAGEFEVLWKIPMRGDMQLALAPAFSGETRITAPIVSRKVKGAVVQTWRLRAVEPLRGETLRIDGLETTLTDTLVRATFIDGEQWVKRLTPTEPQADLPRQADGWTVMTDYFRLGVEHILSGIDHLLFVLALMLITAGGWVLVKTITAFTLAHSLTLVAAVLGWVQVPSAPVEAVIALSIVFVASEIIHARRGRESLSLRAPWLVAFSFGLLHGLGFAGALSEIGLPLAHIPLALLFFNLGVEAGQLIFVAGVLAAIVVVRGLQVPLPRWASLLPAYGIGTLAMFWVIQRIAAF